MGLETPNTQNTIVKDEAAPSAPNAPEAAPAPGEIQPNFLEALINAIMSAFQAMGMAPPDEKKVKQAVGELPAAEKDNINKVGENLQKERDAPEAAEGKDKDTEEVKIDKTEEGKKAEGEEQTQDMRDSLGKVFGGLGGEMGLVMGLIALAMNMFQKDVADADAKEVAKDGPEQKPEEPGQQAGTTQQDVSATVTVTESVDKNPRMGGKVDVEVKGTQEVAAADSEYDPNQEISERDDSSRDMGTGFAGFTAGTVGASILIGVIESLGSLVADSGPIGIEDRGDSLAAYAAAEGANLAPPTDVPNISVPEGAGMALA